LYVYKRGNGNCKVSEDGFSLTVDAIGETSCYIGRNIEPGTAIFFDIEYSSPKDAVVGRHGGVYSGFGADFNSPRWPGVGFNVDYIDRNDPRGYRTYFAGGNVKNIAAKEPGKNWKLFWNKDGKTF
jgi:hypothetical protein